MKFLDKTEIDPLISSLDSNEYFNFISHAVGGLIAIVGTTILLTISAYEHKWLHFLCFFIYGSAMILSFLASSLLHGFLLTKRYKRILGIIDHNAIYVLIAGSYTPLCLLVLKDMLGAFLFVIIWALAIVNISVKSIFFSKIPKWLSMMSYLSMGWIALLCVYKIYLVLGVGAIALLLLGGTCFTLGSIVFYKEKPNPFPPYFGNHEIWHIAVLAGNFFIFLIMSVFVLKIS